MNAYKEDPQLALTTLEKIAEEIPSGVSARDVGQIVTTLGPSPDELTNQLRETIVSELKSSLQDFWKSHNVAKKLQDVKNLKCSDAPPTSRQEMLNAINGKYLTLLKEALVTRVDKINKENEELEKQLTAKGDLIKKQLEDIKACDFIS